MSGVVVRENGAIVRLYRLDSKRRRGNEFFKEDECSVVGLFFCDPGKLSSRCAIDRRELIKPFPFIFPCVDDVDLYKLSGMYHLGNGFHVFL